MPNIKKMLAFVFAFLLMTAPYIPVYADEIAADGSGEESYSSEIAPFDEEDAPLSGWREDSTGRWYAYEDGTYPISQWANIDGAWYYFDGRGYMVTGWLNTSGAWYYLAADGAMQTGWQKVSGSWYYLASSGAMKTGWQKIGGAWYYFASSGAMKTGWQKVGGSWYYLAGSGAMVTGWQEIGGSWYYFYSSGKMSSSTYIGSYWVNANGVWVPSHNGNSGSGTSGATSGYTGIVYWTPGGKSYHYSRNCTTLKRSKTIKSGTLQQALAAGKTDPCNVCVE